MVDYIGNAYNSTAKPLFGCGAHCLNHGCPGDCPAFWCGALGCPGDMCVTAACVADACGGAVCGANACGANVCGAEGCIIDGCGANACFIDVCAPVNFCFLCFIDIFPWEDDEVVANN